MGQPAMTRKKPPETALVTGAASGIGKAYARELASRKVKLVLVDIQAEALEKVASEIEQEFQVSPLILVQDLSQHDAPDKCLAFCDEHHFEVDLLINNAGLFIFDPFMDVDETRYEELLGVHIACVTRMCRLFGDRMKKRQYGYILNMSSMSVWMTMPGLSYYNASKAYIRGLSRSLWFELKPFNVSVTAVCPAGVDTPLIPLSDKIRKLAKNLGFLMKPETLAKKALRSALKGKIQTIPGIANDLFAFLMMTLPNGLITFVSHHLPIYDKFWKKP